MQYRHIAIFVPELEAAEVYYRSLFGLEVVLREGPEAGGSGRWAQLPLDKDWDDARAAGVELGMVAIGKGDLVLAMFPGEPTWGQLFAIGVRMADEEIAGVAGRLPEDTAVLEMGADTLDFIDRYGFHWQLTTTSDFTGSGHRDGRWLDA